MTIGYYTDNDLSQVVMRVLKQPSIEIDHIKNFSKNIPQTSIFYGILRGCGVAMRICKHIGVDFYYIDNGYFDARYVDQNMLKDMRGMMRFVKNDMIEPYTWKADESEESKPLNLLVLPPSKYTAFYYDTTPEDWLQGILRKSNELGHNVRIRHKGETQPLDVQLDWCDAIYAYNSMAVMRALELKKAVYTEQGIIRNSADFGKSIQYFDAQKVADFYRNKQFTLEEIRSLKNEAA